MAVNDDIQQFEQKSSVKISSNAKGDPQVEVKVYAGTTEPELNEARRLAVDAYKQTRADVGWPVAEHQAAA